MEAATEAPPPAVTHYRRRARYHLPYALTSTLKVGDDVLDRWGRRLTVAEVGPSGLTLVGDASRRSWLSSRVAWEWVYQAAEELSLIP